MSEQTDPATTDPAETTDAAKPEALGDAGKKALETEREARKRAEKQLAALTGRVEAMQRAEVERIAGAPGDGFRPLADAGDLWRADGIELGSLLDDDGQVDAGKVRAAVGEIVAQRPHWGAPRPRGAGDADTGKGKGAGEPSMAQIAERVIRGA